ncbi:tetratricopeptide repeat protein [Kitasatospora sp. NPDC001664]
MKRAPTVRADGTSSVAVGGDAHGPILTNPVFNVFAAPGPERPSALPRTLPPQPADFTGREEEIGRILGRAGDRSVSGSGDGSGGHSGDRPGGAAGDGPGPEGADRVVVITGKPGVGKTALALHLAHHPDGDFPDGRLYADLRGMADRPSTPEDVMARFLLALGIPQAELPGNPDRLLDAYRLALSGRRLLLVLDNAAEEQQVRPLLPPGGDGALVLVTSRSRLAGLEGADRLDLDTFTPGTALRFLRQVCGAERIDRDLLAAEAVVGYCGGLPLALRITANRLVTNPRLGTAALVRELRDEHDRLEALEAGDLTVRAAFGLSYGRLNKAAKSTFRRLSQVPGEDFGPGVCAALTGFGLREAAKALRRLAEANLIEPAPGDERYRLHDLLRLYSKEQLAEEGAESVTAAARRMYEWYFHAAERTLCHLNGMPMPQALQEGGAPEIASSEDAVRWAEADLSGAIPALRQLLRLAAPDSVVSFASALADVGEMTGRWREWDEAITVGLEAAEQVENQDFKAVLLLQRAELARARRQFREGMEIAQEVSALAEAEGNALLLATSDNLVALLYMSLGTPAQARPLLERSLRLSQELGDHRLASRVLFNLGTVHRAQGDFETAVEYFRRDLRFCEEVQDTPGTAEALNTLATTLVEVGDRAAAEPYQRRALDIFRQLGNGYKESMVLNDLAVTIRHQGRYEEALGMHLADAELCAGLGHRSGEALAKSNAAIVLTSLGRNEEALPLAEEAVAVLAELGDDQWLVQGLGIHAVVLFAVGEDDEAGRSAGRALEILDQHGWHRGRAELHFNLAIGYDKAGCPRETLDHAEAFLSLRERPSEQLRTPALVMARGAAAELGDEAKALRYEELLSTTGP